MRSRGELAFSQGKANSWLSEPYKDMADHVRSSTVVNADETTHWSMGKRAWLWVLSSFNSVLFMTHPSAAGCINLQLSL